MSDADSSPQIDKSDILVSDRGVLRFAGRRWRCALGRGGLVHDKHEGDGGTPVGRFPLRRVLYRADRLARPSTGLPTTIISQAVGWCDDPADPAYNRQVTLPYPASCERIWRQDHLYDVVMVLGHNDAPPLAGRGSAIFLHQASLDFTPTEGCVALALEDLLSVLRDCEVGTSICIAAD